MTESAIAPSALDDSSKDLTDAENKARSKNLDRIHRAVDALEAGKPDKARSLVDEVIKDGRVSAGAAAYVVRLLQALGDEERATAIRNGTVATLQRVLGEHPDNTSAHLNSALVFNELGDKDAAEQSFLRAMALSPHDMRAGLPLINIKLQKGDVDGLLAAWEPLLDAIPKKDIQVAARSLIKGLGHFGHVERALDFAERIRDRWGPDQSGLDKLVTILKHPEADGQDLGALIEEFDNFSTIYDENLAAIGNRGPQLIARMIHELDWQPDGSRAIFDAGCGTGLCGPYLRPFAQMLHGCDLSIGMLEKSKARNVFDLLTRTDLANPATYPDATFTDVVSADVFVYFGDLEPVLRNLAAVMKPGGWIIFTVEDAEAHAPARGWERYSSGRYRHMMRFVETVLPKAGFTKPKRVIRDTLRHEFGTPIPGLCVAAQKLAFAL